MIDINKIAIQGVEGSFHDVVAKSYFNKNINIHCCSTFDELVDSILKKQIFN